MNKTLEVRWHGRGGQGAKSASAILAEVLFEEGKHVQAFPEYGAERRARRYALQQSLGFPDTPPLQRAEPQYSRRRRPDDGRERQPDRRQTEDAVYLVNSAENAKELRRRLGVSSKAKVLVVDATKITLEELGQNRPNAPLLGALSHVFTDVPVESFVNHFTSKMTKLPQPVLEPTAARYCVDAARRSSHE